MHDSSYLLHSQARQKFEQHDAFHIILTKMDSGVTRSRVLLARAELSEARNA